MISSDKENKAETSPQGKILLDLWQRIPLSAIYEGEAGEGAVLTSEVEEVRYGGGQMGHQLQSDPPVGLRGAVPCVWTFRHDGIGDVFQNRSHILLSAVAVRTHQSHVLLEVGFPIILFNMRGGLIPQLVGRAGNNVTGQDAGGHDEVSRLHYRHFDSPGFHLVAKAVRKGFHAVFRHAVRRAHGISHPAIHAGKVHNTTCGHTENRQQTTSYFYLCPRNSLWLERKMGCYRYKDTRLM